ncbi:MAG: hypothetical protein ABIZ56_03780 [Chthoniobacteraceae bacterium]
MPEAIDQQPVLDRHDQITVHPAEAAVGCVASAAALVRLENCLPHEERLGIIASNRKAEERVRAAGSRENVFADTPSTAVILAFARSALSPEKIEERVFRAGDVMPLPHIALQAGRSEVFNDEVRT